MKKEKTKKLICKEHPTYTGKRKPRNNCKKCWAIYAEVNKISKEELKKLKKEQKQKDNQKENNNQQQNKKEKQKRIKQSKYPEGYETYMNNVQYWNKKDKYGYTRAMWSIVYNKGIEYWKDIIPQLDWETPTKKDFALWLLEITDISFIEEILKRKQIREMLKATLYKNPLQGLSAFEKIIQPDLIELGKANIYIEQKFNKIKELLKEYNLLE